MIYKTTMIASVIANAIAMRPLQKLSARIVCGNRRLAGASAASGAPDEEKILEPKGGNQRFVQLRDGKMIVCPYDVGHVVWIGGTGKNQPLIEHETLATLYTKKAEVTLTGVGHDLLVNAVPHSADEIIRVREMVWWGDLPEGMTSDADEFKTAAKAGVQFGRQSNPVKHLSDEAVKNDLAGKEFHFGNWARDDHLITFVKINWNKIKPGESTQQVWEQVWQAARFPKRISDNMNARNSTGKVNVECNYEGEFFVAEINNVDIPQIMQHKTRWNPDGIKITWIDDRLPANIVGKHEVVSDKNRFIRENGKFIEVGKLEAYFATRVWHEIPNSRFNVTRKGALIEKKRLWRKNKLEAQLHVKKEYVGGKQTGSIGLHRKWFPEQKGNKEGGVAMHIQDPSYDVNVLASAQASNFAAYVRTNRQTVTDKMNLSKMSVEERKEWLRKKGMYGVQSTAKSPIARRNDLADAGIPIPCTIPQELPTKKISQMGSIADRLERATKRAQASTTLNPVETAAVPTVEQLVELAFEEYHSRYPAKKPTARQLKNFCGDKRYKAEKFTTLRFSDIKNSKYFQSNGEQ